uniref:hypothetical protein n=1 Tax=Algoriphagus sp. oki45 TaxID=3067294 RepID=UPI0030C77739
MEVGHRKQFGFPLGYPFLPVLTLTLRAVPVPTTIVADPGIPAVGTGIHMAAQIGSPAAF